MKVDHIGTRVGLSIFSKHYTAPRAIFTHANISTRVAQGAEQTPARFMCVRFLKQSLVILVCHVSCAHCGLTSRLFLLSQHIPSPLYPSHSAEQPHDPRTTGQSGRLAVHKSSYRLCEPNAIVEVSSAEVTPFLLRTEEQVSVQCIILVRTSQLRLCLRKSMRDKEWECWRHRCSCRRQQQVQRLQEFITLKKVLCEAHLTFEVQGDLLRCTHASGNRAETQEAQM